MQSRKMVLKNLFIGQQWRNGHREWTYVHEEGRGEERRGESEMYGKSNMETYITICKIDSQQEFAAWLRNSNRGSVSQPRGLGWGLR